MKKNKIIVFALLLLVWAAVPGQANYLERLQLEENISNKAQHILDTMYGKYKFAVSTTVSMGQESWRVRYTERANIKGSKPQSKGGGEVTILPGYTAIRNLAPDEQAQLPFNSQITKVPPSVRNISIDIIVSKDVPKKETRRVEKILKEILSLNDRRGDSILFTFETFPVVAVQTAEGTEEVGPSPVELILSSMNRSMSIFLGLLGLFMMIYILYQRKLVKAAKESAASKGGSAPPPAPRPLDLGSGGSKSVSGPTGGPPTMKNYFDFISADNIENLGAIVLREKLSPQHIGVILSFLNAHLSGTLLRVIGMDEQILKLGKRKFYKLIIK